jgi:methylglutaconyl-CoA hydratase
MPGEGRRTTLELRGAVAHLRLCRPEARNAFDDELIAELSSRVEELVAGRRARIVVLGAEGSAFSAGADIEWMRRLGAAGPEENARSAERMAALFELLDTLPLPLVARVQGAAIGGGAGLVATSDVAIASSTALFALSEVRLGLVPAVIGPYVIQRIGAARARELILAGRRIDAREALEIGLVHRVVEEADLDQAIERVTGELLAGGPEAQARAKRIIREVAGRRPAEVAAQMAREIAEARAGAEAQAGLEAFLRKEPPPWAPRREPGGGGQEGGA